MSLNEDGTLSIHETSAANGFVMLYENTEDNSDYFFGDAFIINSISRPEKADSPKKQLPKKAIKPRISDTSKFKFQSAE